MKNIWYCVCPAICWAVLVQQRLYQEFFIYRWINWGLCSRNLWLIFTSICTVKVEYKSRRDCYRKYQSPDDVRYPIILWYYIETKKKDFSLFMWCRHWGKQMEVMSNKRNGYKKQCLMSFLNRKKSNIQRNAVSFLWRKLLLRSLFSLL